MSEVFILRWTVKDECEIHKSVNFFYLKSEKIHCCTIGLNHEEFFEFKSVRNKHKFIEIRIKNNEFILNECIEHLITAGDFIKKYRLERKVRNRKLKSVLKKP